MGSGMGGPCEGGGGGIAANFFKAIITFSQITLCYKIWVNVQTTYTTFFATKKRF